MCIMWSMIGEFVSFVLLIQYTHGIIQCCLYCMLSRKNVCGDDSFRLNCNL
jgi:hypothetical protein